MKTTDSRPVFVRRQSCLTRIAELDRQLDALVAAKASARAALKEIEHECGEAPTLRSVEPDPESAPAVSVEEAGEL